MILDQMNLNQLRVFESVFRTGSMTEASQELHLTQSGVSQHIKLLEEMLGVPLFDRIKQRLVPTGSSRVLYEHCVEGFKKIEEGLLQIKGQEKELSGSVTLGMPIEFGNNLVVPLLSKFGRMHPNVSFHLRLGYASDMNEELVKGRMDFAFIDDFRMDKRVATKKVYDEVLDLYISDCLARKLSAPKLQARYFEAISYVEYTAGEPLLRMWFAHHLGARDAKSMRLNVKATVMDVQGVARFIASEAGAGILPSYLVSKLNREGSALYRFKGCGTPLVNKISLAWLRDRTHSAASRALLEFLQTSLTEAKK